MKYTEKVQLYNSSPNATQDQCCRLRKISLISLHIPKSVNMENHNKTCPSCHATTVVCITLLAQQTTDKRKILYSVQVTITVNNNNKHKKIWKKWQYCTENTTVNILYIISSPSWIWPESFINITSNILISKTTQEELSWMSNPSLHSCGVDLVTGLLHCLNEGYNIGSEIINIPLPCRRGKGKEGRVLWEVLE